MTLIITTIVCTIIFISFLFLGIRIESKGYNDGICPKCGKPLHWFDIDSQGGRGYRCISCHYKTWVSYRTVDKHYGNIMYLCDQKACTDCSYPMCKHTTDIGHAKNLWTSDGRKSNSKFVKIDKHTIWEMEED